MLIYSSDAVNLDFVSFLLIISSTKRVKHLTYLKAFNFFPCIDNNNNNNNNNNNRINFDSC